LDIPRVKKRSHAMKRETVLRILSTHRQDLKNFHVKALALFGSVARDEARAESDVDLLVEFEGRATFDRYMDLKFFLEECLGCRVDLVTRDALKPRLRPQVEKEAILVA
jgi:predicted nucleotidyltransferase